MAEEKKLKEKTIESKKVDLIVETVIESTESVTDEKPALKSLAEPVVENTKSEEGVVGSLSNDTEETNNNVQSFGFEVSIMALDSVANILSITTSLGTAYSSVLGTIDSPTDVDALYKIAEARQTATVNATTDEYDAYSAMATAFRNVEKKLVSDVKPVMKACCTALEAYSKASYAGKKFRDKWNATSAGVNDPFFTENFQKLWRDQMSEELIVKIGTVTKAAGVWPATITKIYTLNDVRVATTGVLPNTPTYSSGVLTAGANAALAAQDGVTLSAGDRILVKNQAAAEQNGVYVVTSIGSAGAPWMLRRATDADAASATEVSYGMSVYVTAGSTLAGKRYFMSNASFTTIGASGVTGNQDFTLTTLSPVLLDENLELRVVGASGLATTDEIVATLVVQKADLTTSLQTVTIPVGTAVGTRFAIGTSAIKGVTISSVSIASDNGANNDLLEIWVKSAA